jgi:cytochrome c oxidase subunit 1
VLPVFSRKPLFGYSVVIFSGIAIGFMGWGVWAHHMFATGLGPVAISAFGLSTMLIAIPTGVKIFNWLGTVYGGAVRLTTSMLFSLGFIAMFTLGGLSGVLHSIVPADTQQTDTYFVVAHFHYVMMGGTVIAFLGGLHYWWPKMTGRMYSEKWGRIATALVFIGFNMTFGSQFIMGGQGMPRRYFNYLDQFQPIHAFSTYGSWVLGSGLFLTAIYLLASLKTGPLAPDNPWGGTTMEWESSSPPVVHNFEEQPVFEHEPYDYRHRTVTHV